MFSCGSDLLHQRRLSVKSWNTHAWYCVAILLALLIGTISVEWNTVERLPEIISFAVGLSSLLLAVFTIVQSMTASNEVGAALGSVREAAHEIGTTAADVTAAAADLKTLSGSMLQSSEAGRIALSELKDEMTLKMKIPTLDPYPIGSRSSEKAKFLHTLTFGGAGALYAAIIAFKAKKSFNMKEIFISETVAHEDGFLAGLRASGFLVDRI
jgi:hypothetical protein